MLMGSNFQLFPVGPSSLSIRVYRPYDLTAEVHSFLGTYKNEQALNVAREMDSKMKAVRDGGDWVSAGFD